MRYVVTGGCGFIGSNLVEELVGREHNVTILDNMMTGNEANIKDLRNVKLVKGDSGDLDALCTKPDFIFHLGMPSSSPMYMQDNSLIGKTINSATALFNYCTENNIPLVFASTSSIYNGHSFPWTESMYFYHVSDYYTETRLAIERLAQYYKKNFGLRYTALRFFSVYGKNEIYKKQYANILTQMVCSQRFTVYGDGRQTRDFVHVSDVVKALLAAEKHCGERSVFNVGTGVETSFIAAAEMIKQYKPIELVFKGELSSNYVKRTRSNNQEADSHLGFTAKINIDEGIERLCDEYAGKTL